MCCGSTGQKTTNGSGYALVLVLFILIIIVGAAWFY